MNKLRANILQSAGSINMDAKNSLDQPVEYGRLQNEHVTHAKAALFFSFPSVAR